MTKLAVLCLLYISLLLLPVVELKSNRNNNIAYLYLVEFVVIVLEAVHFLTTKPPIPFPLEDFKNPHPSSHVCVSTEVALQSKVVIWFAVHGNIVS